MAENQVTIEVSVDAKDAQAAIELFGQNAVKSVKKAESSVDSFKSSLAGMASPLLAVAGGFAALYKGIEGGIDAEKSVRSLSLAIASTGEYSKEAVKELQDYAEALSDITGIDNDAIVSSLNLAKSFGITNAAAKNLVDAAANLSAVTGRDLDSSVKILGGSLDGTIGKLRDLGPEFRDLTEEQAKNGGAIELLNKRYGDAKELLGIGFAASLNKLKNAFDDLFKTVGTELAQDNDIQSGINNLTTSIKSLGPAVTEVTKVFINGFKTIATGASVIGIALAQVSGDILNALGIKALDNSLNNIQSSLANSVEALTKTGDASESSANKIDKLDAGLKKISKNASPLGESFGKAREELQKFVETLNAEFGDDIDKVRIKTEEALKKLDKLAKDAGQRNAQEISDLKLKITDKLLKDIAKINEEAEQKELERQKKANDEFNHLLDLRKERLQKQRDDIARIAANPGQELANGVNLSNTDQLTALGVGITSNILDGAKGATKLVTSTIGGIADIFLPGIGGAVAGLAEQLSKGPEATKIMVREFVKAVPDIVEAIAESIPVVVEVFLDTMINRGGAVRIGVAIVKGMFTASLLPKIGEMIASGFGQLDFSGARQAIADGFQQFADALNQFGSNIIQGLVDFFAGLVKNIQDAFSPVTDAINGLLQPINDLIAALQGGKGGGKGLLGEGLGKLGINTGSGGGNGVIGDFGNTVASALGFSHGGIVPRYAASGFQPKGVDTVPAMLQPGELVVSKDTNTQLATYLSKNSGNDQAANDAMLMQILAAVSQPMIVQTEAKVNQSAFADIILQLNRQNSRLSA